MKSKILFIANELPYPPRNGVTIPSYYYMKELQPNDVDMLFLPRKTSDFDDLRIKLNREYFHDIFILPLTQEHRLIVALKHLLLVKPSFFSYHLNLNDLNGILNQCYDTIIYSPISSTIVHRHIEEFYIGRKRPLMIGLFNDCFSYAVKTLGSLNASDFNLPFRERIKLLGRFVDSFWIKYFEKKIVSGMDLIVCQTDIDAREFKKIGFKNELLVLPNGVSPELYKMEVQVSRVQQILFLGSLGGKYSFIVEWLITNAWPQIISEFPLLKLKLVGKGLNSVLAEYISNDPTIEYVPFIDSIKDAYSDSQIFIAPIFMKCGLINKVIEAMAAGLVVLGDETAFNGINNFRKDVHGIVITSHEEIIDQLKQLLSDNNKLAEIQANAKSLILSDFNWETRTEIFNGYLRKRDEA